MSEEEEQRLFSSLMTHHLSPPFLVSRLLLLAVAGRGGECGESGLVAVVSAAAHHRAHVRHAHHARHAAHHPAFESAAAPARVAEEARARELLQHLPHLHVLLDELVDLRHARPRAARDASAAPRVEYAVVFALLPRHRVDDGLGALQLMLHLGRLLVVELRHADAAEQLVGQHLHNLRERAHALDLPQLRAEVVERELVLLKFFELRLGLRLIDLRLHLLDEREHVAHAEYALRDAVGVEGFERVVLLADADELHGLTRHLLDGERGAAAGVAVHLRQDDARDAYAAVELFRRAHRVLTRHRVRDEENLGGARLRLNLYKLLHQLFVDVESARGVYEERVVAGLLRVLESLARQFDRVVRLGLLEYGLPRRLGDDRELLARGGAVNVRGDQKRLALLVLREPHRYLARRGRLARPLQADDHHDVRARLREDEARRGAAQKLDQLVEDYLDDLLGGLKLLPDLLPLGLRLDRRDEVFGDLVVHVRFEQREADFAQRGVNVLGCEHALAAQILQRALQLVG